jgi:glycosyltransferase involved in cell wall biosynthesis
MTHLPVVSSFVSEPYALVRLQALPPTVQWKLKGIQLLDRITAQWVFHFVANSNSIKISNSQMLHVPESRISVIYRGRDPGLFMVSHNGNGTLPNLDRNISRPFILNVGRLTSQKGQAELIRAMALVSKRMPSTRLLIAGEGDQRSKLESLIRDLNLRERVSLPGTRRDIPGLLAMANVFAFSSTLEGHPGALVEAMFAACPIVVTDIPVHRETITSGETGLLVPPNNPEAMAQAIIWMLEHPTQAKEMGQQARVVALQRFHIDQIAAQYEALYETLVQQWRAKR